MILKAIIYLFTLTLLNILISCATTKNAIPDSPSVSYSNTILQLDKADFEVPAGYYQVIHEGKLKGVNTLECSINITQFNQDDEYGPMFQLRLIDTADNRHVVMNLYEFSNIEIGITAGVVDHPDTPNEVWTKKGNLNVFKKEEILYLVSLEYTNNNILFSTYNKRKYTQVYTSKSKLLNFNPNYFEVNASSLDGSALCRVGVI